MVAQHNVVPVAGEGEAAVVPAVAGDAARSRRQR